MLRHDGRSARARVGAQPGFLCSRTDPGYPLGSLMALIMFAFLSWNLGRPAFWLDESASVVATQRSWPDLFRLLQGADAPLVPYYAVLKSTTGLLQALSPAVADHPEVLYRFTSAVAVALARGVLIGWLDRQVSRPVVLITAILLLLAGGLSRYGQEARPYGLVLLGAVSATVLWTVMIRDERYRWRCGYAVAVAVTVALHDLTAVLVASGPDLGRLRVRRSAVFPQESAGQRRGQGARSRA